MLGDFLTCAMAVGIPTRLRLREGSGPHRALRTDGALRRVDLAARSRRRNPHPGATPTAIYAELLASEAAEHR